MSSNRDFFESPQAAAIYKHKLLKSYVPIWAGKVGSTSVDRRVVVYDAYSGPGRYKDAQPGSPELLVDTAIAMAELRTVHTVFSEKDQTYCDRLEEMMAGKRVNPQTYEIRPGPVEDHVGTVLAQARDLPLFVFLDPYGLTIPLEDVVNILTARDKPQTSLLFQPKTELLMNFSYEAVRRISGVLRSPKDYPAKESQVRALDNALGGDWWHGIALGDEEDLVDKVLEGYANRVREQVGGGYITAAVADSLNSKPVYELILFTRHRDGLWAMMGAMSYARKEWREWLVMRREESTGGQTEFRGLDFDDNESAWIAEIASNIEALLHETAGFTIENMLSQVLGRTLGLARETHIRKALKALKARGVIQNVPTGSLQRAYVSRG